MNTLPFKCTSRIVTKPGSRKSLTCRAITPSPKPSRNQRRHHCSHCPLRYHVTSWASPSSSRDSLIMHDARRTLSSRVSRLRRQAHPAHPAISCRYEHAISLACAARHYTCRRCGDTLCLYHNCDSTTIRLRRKIDMFIFARIVANYMAVGGAAQMRQMMT